MPSGFQQDTNQLAPGFYRVVLNLSSGTANWGQAAPANGAVNPYNWDSFATLPTTDANSQRLSRGNMRWQAIIEQVSKFADAQIIDVEVTSSDETVANNIPTQVAFTVKYDRDSFVLPAVRTEIYNATGAYTFTPTTGGAVTVDSTAKAIRYLIGQAVNRNAYTKKWYTYQASTSEGTLQAITINTPDTLAKLYDDITVAILDGTEVVSVV